MRKFFTLGYLSVLLLLAGVSYGQDLNIKGKVLAGNSALPGASILLKEAAAEALPTPTVILH